MDQQTKQLMQDAFERGRYKDAIKIADNYLQKQNPDDWDALYMKASIYSTPMPEYTNYYIAIGMIISALNYNRNNANCWFGAGEVLDSCGIYPEAERCYKKVLEMDPKNYEVHLHLACLQGSPGTETTQDEVEMLLRNAIDIKPNDWRAYHYLALLLVKKGDKGKAGEMYKNALDRFSIDKDGQDMFDEITKQLKNL